MLDLTIKLDTSHAGEDRLFAQASGDQALIAIADGVGGTGSGGQAAAFLCNRAASEVGEAHDGAWWARWLAETDRLIQATHPGAETTAVVVQVARGQVSGASVGDSAAWLITATGYVDLTEGQVTKPRVGSGAARPVAFGPIPMSGRILAATDGLFNYLPLNDIATWARVADPDVAANALIDALRLRSGALPDDLALVLCEESEARVADAALVEAKMVVYVQLLDEGTVVYRPVHATIQSHDIVVLEPPDDYDPEDERWEFPPGSVVRVGYKMLSGGVTPIAVAIVE